MNHNCCKFPINYPSNFHPVQANCGAHRFEVNYDGQLTIIESLTASWNCKSSSHRPRPGERENWVHVGCSESLLPNNSCDNVGHDFLFIPTVWFFFRGGKKLIGIIFTVLFCCYCWPSSALTITQTSDGWQSPLWCALLLELTRRYLHESITSDPIHLGMCALSAYEYNWKWISFTRRVWWKKSCWANGLRWKKVVQMFMMPYSCAGCF